MALGTLGSTLNDELNRLANGGTYRDMNQMVDEALAAKQWANRENINPYSTDTVGILNEIAGLGLDKKNWLDFNGVCNYIAGTTGLPAAAALRQVYPTTDLLTGVASYYVDAATPTNWGSLGYVQLNGVSGNYLSTPDSNALDITGDIDIRVRVAMDDWTPAADSVLLAKESSATTRSYRFMVTTTGALSLVWSTNGSSITQSTSSASTGIADGTVKWVRVTLDVDNGASGYSVDYYTSDDGTTWTKLGNTDTVAGVTSIFNSTSPVEIGSRSLGILQLVAAKIYRAQVLNGIGGTTVLDVNIATDFKASNEDTFTATTGQTVTVNGVDTIANLGAAGSLLPTTLGSSTAADSNDPKFLDFTGTNYVYLPGTASNHISTPDSSALRITGDIDLRAFIALDDWTPAAATDVLMKWETTAQRAYLLRVETTGRLSLIFTTDGATSITVTSTASPTISDGSPLWVRATRVASTGVCQFFTSTNGTTWTQLGTDVTGTSGNIFSGTSDVSIGRSTGTLAGKVFRAQIFNGIDGTKVLDVDTSVITAGSATSFTAVTGQTVTINRSTSGRKTVAVTQPTWLFGTDDYMEVNNRYMAHTGTNYLYLPGVASNYASAPDSAALDITGDIDLRAKVALDDWTPAASSFVISKNQSGQVSYYLNVLNTGALRLMISLNGTAETIATSTVVNTIPDGTTKWVRATRVASTGTVQFFTSDDGSSWTQLGADVSTTSGNIAATTSFLEIGTTGFGGNAGFRGKVFRAQVRNGINGTVAFDANFETSITSLNQASFTESSANAATVTINRSGSAYRSAGITTAGYLYPGATNTFSASATDFLNFGATDSFTMVVINRYWGTSGGVPIISKAGGGSTQVVGEQITTNRFVVNSDGINNIQTASVLQGNGTLTTAIGVRDKSNSLIIRYLNSIAGASVSDTSGNLSNIGTLQLARVGGIFGDAEIYAAAVFRQALTTSQVRQISNYFANREVYL